MTLIEKNELKVGDLIASEHTGQTYVVVNNDGYNPPVVARVTIITNCNEWQKVKHG